MSKDAWLYAAGDESAVAGGFYPTANNGRFVTNGTESQCQAKVKAGTLDKLQFTITDVHAATFTTISRINTANGNLTATSTASTPGLYEDQTHSDTVADSDLVCTKGTPSAGSFTVAGVMGFHYLASAAITTVTGASGNNTFDARFGSTANYFGPMLGGYNAGILGNTESAVQHKVRAPGTHSFLRTIVVANSKTITTSYVFRKGGVDGNLTNSYVTLVTGTVDDTTHSDTTAGGDLVNFKVASDTTGNSLTCALLCAIFVGSAQQFDACSEAVGGQGSTTVANYCQLVGGIGLMSTTEGNRQTRFRWASSTNNFRINTISNGTTGFTWTLRINSADGTQAVTQGNTTTGFVEDATHKDSISSGDLVNYKMGTASSNSGTQNHVHVSVGISSNNAAIATVFGGISQTLNANVQDVTHIATVFGLFSQAGVLDVEPTFRGPIATVFGLFSQVVAATDIGVRGTGIRRFWTF